MHCAVCIIIIITIWYWEVFNLSVFTLNNLAPAHCRHPQCWRVKYYKMIRLFLKLLAGVDWEVKFWDRLRCDSSSDEEMRLSLSKLGKCPDCWPQGSRWSIRPSYRWQCEGWELRGGPGRPPRLWLGLLLSRPVPRLSSRQTLTQLYFKKGPGQPRPGQATQLSDQATGRF